MNKRQAKKRWYNYISASGRVGCEECDGTCSRIPIDSETGQWWFGVSIMIHKIKKEWRMTIRANKVNENGEELNEKEDVCYTRIRYCPFCGRKLK